jgi:serine/threonine protein kinase
LPLKQAPNRQTGRNSRPAIEEMINNARAAAAAAPPAAPSEPVRGRAPSLHDDDSEESRSSVLRPLPITPAAKGPAELRGEVIDNRYRLGRTLGQGAFGTVYEAENLRVGGRVALKLLTRADTRTVKRFAQEARISGTILHPNVCRVFDTGWVKERPFIVMELLSGENLAARLGRRGALSPPSAIDMAMQVLAGLGAAHEVGVVHRDVKPQNVFLVAREGYHPMVKLLDFGLAKALRKETRGQTQTMYTLPGKTVGTVAYMSPEQLQGGQVDARSDLFSCAVVLYESLTRMLPWAGRNPADIGGSILRDEPRPIPNQVMKSSFPQELITILARGLAKERDDRFQSAIEFMRALGALQRRRPSVASLALAAPDDDTPREAVLRREREEETERVGASPSSIPKLSAGSDTGGENAAPGPRRRTTHSTLPRLYSMPPISRGPITVKTPAVRDPTSSSNGRKQPT